jgi:hypothetical protein
MADLIWLIGLAIIVGVATIDVFTLRSIRHQQHPRVWIVATSLLLIAGVATGFWCGFFLRYAWAENKEALGFPIPILIFQWEDGRWVDYVGNPFLAFVSLFLVASAFLLPISFGVLLAWLRRRFSS